MYHVYVPKISYSLPLRWYLGYLSVRMLVVDKRLCLLRWVHYICVVQRETKRESSPPTFRLGFLLVTPLAKERRRSFEITYLGVKVHRPLSPQIKNKNPCKSIFYKDFFIVTYL
jgi:hypothetical protein